MITPLAPICRLLMIAALLVISAASRSLAQSPLVTTGPAKWETSATTTLTGTVNPNGYATTVKFEYGTTTAYGTVRTVTISPNNDNIDHAVSADLGTLPAGSTYHYRLTATNANDTTNGEDHLFITERSSGLFKYTTSDNTATITGYTGAGGAISIPLQINGLVVVAIGESAFANNNSITSVNIPTGVISIGDNAFYYCKGLTSAIISNTVVSIGSKAFWVTGLTSVSIPASVTSIGYGAFQYGGGLTAIVVDAGNSSYSSLDGVLYNKDRTTLIYCPAGMTGSFEVPESVTSISKYAFQGSKLLSVSIHAGVTSIGYNPFYQAANLTQIEIAIDNPNYSSLGGVFFNKVGTTLLQFPGGKSGSYDIPPTVTLIRENAFVNCTKLTNIGVPNSVTIIERFAFISCRSLSSVIIPSGVTSIGTQAFFDCTSLTAIMVDPGNSYFSSVDGVLFNKTLTTLIQHPPRAKAGAYTIPASVTSIGRDAFSSCTGLTNVTLPASVTSIGIDAFSSCTGLKSALYLGNAPTMGSSVFSNAATGFTVYYLTGKSGFTTPTWQGYPAVAMSDPGIVTHPASDAIASGSTAALTVTAIGTEPLTYQWYQGTSGTTSTPVGSNSANFTTPALTGATSYWVKVSNAATPTGVNSNTATVSVTSAPGLNLIGHWITGAQILSDASGYAPIGAHDGVAQGAPAWSTDVPAGFTGSSLDLSAGNSGVLINNSATTDAGYINTFDSSTVRSQFSVCFWTKGFPAGGAWNPWVSKNGEANGWQVRRYMSTNTPTFTIRNTAGADDPSLSLNTNDNTWHHYASVFDGVTGTRKLYIDGVNYLNMTGDTGSVGSASGSHLVLGGRDNGGLERWFSGKLFDVRIYNLPLTASEVNNIRTTPLWVIAVEQPAGNGLTNGGAVNFGTSLTNVAITRTFTIKNGSTTALSGIAVTKDGANSDDYVVTTAPATSLAVGASTTFVVTFSPSANGTRVAALHIASTDVTLNPFHINLTGTGTVLAPLVTTGAASGITDVTASLSGTVNPNGFATTALFEYGFTPSYGSTAVATLSPNNGTTVQNVSAVIGGLQPEMTYHYRLVAANGVTVQGEDRTFTTYPAVPFAYTSNNGAITLTAYTGSASAAIIPATINGLPVTGIGDFAFANRTDLSAVTIPEDVLTIGNYAFYNCMGLATMAIPDSVTQIGDGAFAYCIGLEDILIGTGVTHIGNFAFSSCGSLPEIVIPDNVIEIGDYAFSFCTGLNRVDLGSGVTNLGAGAFYFCGNVSTITLPGSIIGIQAQAFAYCSSLSRACFTGDAPLMGMNVFQSVAGVFAISHFEGATGFTGPPWDGFTLVNMGSPTPLVIWLVGKDYPHNASLQEDSNGDGVNLLMAYALDLDPKNNLCGSMPKPVIESTQMNLSFYAGRPDVMYAVESSGDLFNWSSQAVIVSDPDTNQVRTASVSTSGPQRYMRIVVRH